MAAARVGGGRSSVFAGLGPVEVVTAVAVAATLVALVVRWDDLVSLVTPVAGTRTATPRPWQGGRS